MLWYLPLEYLDKRYTVLMDKQLKEGFKSFNIEYSEISGDVLSDKIDTGAFLDSDSTNYFKFSQLQKVCNLFYRNKIKDGDVFFVSDLWFPGLISIPYMSMFHNIKTHITGIMHAGSWTDTDYVNQLKDWARDVESGWFKMIDTIFLGSEFHKQDIINKLSADSDKLYVTGLPFDTEDIITPERQKLMSKKENIVIFNSRLDDEKQPKHFDAIERDINNIFGSDVEFIKTMELNLDKQEYFDLLAKSKVVFSSALQENYGYGILEAVTLGCSPVVPDTLSYIEMYPKCFRYNSLHQAYSLVYKYLNNHINVSYISEYYNGSVDRILTELKIKYQL